MSIAQIKAHKDIILPGNKKKCNQCNKILPLIKYHRRKRRSGTLGWQHICKECAFEKWQEYLIENIEKVRGKNREYARQHKEESRIRNKARSIRLKKEAFEAYGGIKCSCCGITELVFLTIDHINGGGGKHRKQIKNSMYKWLKDNNYPPGYRVLCWNCNWAEAHGGCPHDRH